MTTTTVTVLWGLAMLVAVAVHALGWRSWLATFGRVGASSGSVDLPGTPQEVSERIAKALVAGTATVTTRILEADSHVVRARLRPVVSGSRRGRSSIGESGGAHLVCHIDQRMDGCRVDYSLDAAELGANLRSITALVLGLGSCAIVAAAVLFPLVVIPSENPAIRGQTAQVLQLVHFLWPPFLLSFQARRARTAATEHAMDLMSNLPYLGR
jgi:hypothetical protein